MSSEAYPRAPVCFVAFVLRFPLVPKLQRREAKEEVYERLAEAFPLFENVDAMSMQMPLPGPASEQAMLRAAAPEKARMMNRGRTRSVMLGPRMVAVEGTEHSSFEHLRSLLDQVLQALVEGAAPSGMIGVTLRYVNEIRHPSASAPGDWKGLIADSLLGPTAISTLRAQHTVGSAVYQLSERHHLRLGYGAAAEGFAVDPDGPLRVQRHESGPFFGLDLDSEWAVPEDAVPPLVVDDVLQIADTLHDAIRDVFESAITSELREYFRGHNGDR